MYGELWGNPGAKRGNEKSLVLGKLVWEFKHHLAITLAVSLLPNTSVVKEADSPHHEGLLIDKSRRDHVFLP